MGRRLATSIACILFGSATIALSLNPPEPTPEPLRAARGAAYWAIRARNACADTQAGELVDQSPIDRALTLPTGEPTSLACDDARTVVQQARSSLAAPGSKIDAAKFAEAAIDWLDPHGLWSVAPDTPVGPLLQKSREHLVAELEAEPGAGPCAVAAAIGRELVSWSAELGASFDEGLRAGADRALPGGTAEAWRIASTTPFQDGEVTRTSRELARDIGSAAGALRAAYGPAMDPYVEAARARIAPAYDGEAWSKVVTAAALRAYVPQLDAHGAWAPLDEELSIYDLALEAAPPERLWTDMTRTAIGVRIDRGAAAPLADGDVVLRVQEVPLAGVSVEQVEQLSVIENARQGGPARVTVLRARAAAPLELVVQAPREVAASTPAAATQDLPVEMLRYADGQAALVSIIDVPDDLGARLGDALDRARQERDVRGLVLDLRSNGGGSTDGATAALGLFIPGASLFPMRRRDGAIEVERAPDVPAEKRWGGPVAVLVDGDSASAAEMIAGALASYRRAVVIGDRTYGKGCAQEYLDDDAHAGVLRLTTLLFALPDGSPLQKTGILPNVRFSLPSTNEREALLGRALDAWRGPDVRDLANVREVAWPNHAGRVGPCADPVVCKALRALGSTRSARSGGSAGPGRSGR